MYRSCGSPTYVQTRTHIPFISGGRGLRHEGHASGVEHAKKQRTKRGKEHMITARKGTERHRTLSGTPALTARDWSAPLRDVTERRRGDGSILLARALASPFWGHLCLRRQRRLFRAIRAQSAAINANNNNNNSKKGDDDGKMLRADGVV